MALKMIRTFPEIWQNVLYGINFEAINTSYFIGKESLIIKSGTNMNLVRKNIFVTLFRSAENITNQFHLPVNRVVELGSQVLF